MSSLSGKWKDQVFGLLLLGQGGNPGSNSGRFKGIQEEKNSLHNNKKKPFIYSHGIINICGHILMISTILFTIKHEVVMTSSCITFFILLFNTIRLICLIDKGIILILSTLSLILYDAQ